QILIQFCLQTGLHEFGNGLLEQVLDVIHAADVCHLQKFTDFLSTGIFFRAAILSGHMLILLYDASILHLSGSLHKLWDSLFHRAIVNAAANTRHTLCHASIDQPLVEVSVGILKSTVTVEDRMRIRISLDCLCKSV